MRTLFTPEALLPEGWARNVRIEIDGHGNIADVATNASPAGCESTGGPVVPGLANLHSHAFQRAMAGLAERASGTGDSFWTWRNLMYRFVAQLTPEDCQAIAAQLYMELIKAGYTAVGEFHYLHNAPGGKPYSDPAVMSFAHVSAAREAGIAMTLLPVLYEQGGFGGQPLVEAQARFRITLRELIRIIESLRRHLGVEREIRIGAAPHSLRAVPPESLRLLIDEVNRIDHAAPLHMHIAEQAKEVADCVKWSGGARPIEWLVDNIELGTRWCLVHCTHATDIEIWRLAATKAVVGLCPTTEANLGDGIFDLPALLEVEGRIGIGSDSHVSRSPAEELRLLEYGQRLARQKRNIATSAETRSVGRNLWMRASLGGAQALGRRSGTIEPGMRADLVVLDADHVDLVGRVGDTILDALVFSGGERMVKHVAVSGRWIVRDRIHVRQDAIESRFKATQAALLRIV